MQLAFGDPPLTSCWHGDKAHDAVEFPTRYEAHKVMPFISEIFYCVVVSNHIHIQALPAPDRLQSTSTGLDRQIFTGSTHLFVEQGSC